MERERERGREGERDEGGERERERGRGGKGKGEGNGRGWPGIARVGFMLCCLWVSGSRVVLASLVDKILHETQAHCMSMSEVPSTQLHIQTCLYVQWCTTTLGSTTFILQLLMSLG